MKDKIILNYDFDNTLTTKFGQEFGFFQAKFPRIGGGFNRSLADK